MRKILIYIGISLFLVSGCVHRVDVPQGNIIEKRELDQLKKGMTRKQVLFLLGTPLLQAPFHNNRWDYVYHFKDGETREITKRSLTIFFKKDKLTKFENRAYPNPPRKVSKK